MHEAVLEGEAIDERLQCRARRAHRARHVDLSGAAVVEIIRRADMREDITGLVVHCEDGERHAGAEGRCTIARQRLKIFLQRQVDCRLHDRRCRGGHRLFRRVRRGERHEPALLRNGGDTRLLRIGGTDLPDRRHSQQQAVARDPRDVGMAIEAPLLRRLGQRDQQRGLVERKALRLFAEIGQRCGAHAFEIAAKRRERQIKVEDLVFCQQPLNLNGADDLPEFAGDGALTSRFDQPRHLHRQRRAAGHDPAPRRQLECSAPECEEIDARMREEAAIFRRNQ